MKTKMILMLIMSISFSIAYGQVTDFKLADYKYFDLKRITLTTDFDLNSDFFKSKERFANITGREKVSKTGFSGRGRFSYFLNNRKWQRFTAVNLSGFYNSERITFETQSESLSTQGISYLDFEFNNRRYFKKNLFLEGNANLGGRSQNTYLEETSVENDFMIRQGEALIELGAGKGRIEFVQSAQTAQFMMRDLQKAGVLNRALTAEDVTVLADHISVVLNERFFDSRIKRIYQIRQLDSVLLATGILNQSDAVAATLLYDNLLYARNNFRYSGSRISAGLSGEYEYSKGKGINLFPNILDFEFGRLGLGGFVNYIWEKPASLYWQHTLTAGLKYSNYSDTEFENSSPFREDFQDGTLDFSYKLGFYPNTRTYLAATVRVGTYYTSDFRRTVFGEKEFNRIADFSFETYYYISPRLRLFANYKIGNTSLTTVNLELINNNEITPNFAYDVQSFFDLGLNFAIF